MDPKASLDDVEKRKFLTLSGLELKPFGLSVGSQSLYRLRYPILRNVVRRKSTDISEEYTASIFSLEGKQGRNMNNAASRILLVACFMLLSCLVHSSILKM
jgi:hypothetical protein